MNLCTIYDFLPEYPDPTLTSNVEFFKAFKEYRRNYKCRWLENLTDEDLKQIRGIMASRLKANKTFLPSENEPHEYVVPQAEWAQTVLSQITDANLVGEVEKAVLIFDPRITTKRNRYINQLTVKMTRNALLRKIYLSWINISLRQCKSVLAGEFSWLMRCHAPGKPTLYDDMSELQFAIYFPNFDLSSHVPKGKAALFLFEADVPYDGNRNFSLVAIHDERFVADPLRNLHFVTRLESNPIFASKMYCLKTKPQVVIKAILPATDFTDYQQKSIATYIGNESIIGIVGQKGSGKSHLTKTLSSAGIYVLDSDDYGKVAAKGEDAEKCLIEILIKRLKHEPFDAGESVFEQLALDVLKDAQVSSATFPVRSRLFQRRMNALCDEKKIISIADYTKLVCRVIQQLRPTFTPNVRPQFVWFAHTVGELHGIMGSRMFEIVPVLDCDTVILSRDREQKFLDAEIFLHKFYLQQNTGMIIRYPFGVVTREFNRRVSQLQPV